MSTPALAVLIIAVALLFDYMNGFHDAANSIATVVSTRVLTPFQAVIWAAFFNFVSPFLFGTAVATRRQGPRGPALVTYVILAGLIGAIAWDFITWWLGLPTSSSHALIGGYAARPSHATSLCAASPTAWMPESRPRRPGRTLVFIVVAPLIGLISAYGLMTLVYWLFRNSSRKMDVYFRKLQFFRRRHSAGARDQRRAEDHGNHHRGAGDLGIIKDSRCLSG